MTKITWVHEPAFANSIDGNYDVYRPVCVSLKRCITYYPYIRHRGNRYIVRMSFEANNSGVADDEFPTLEEAQEYVGIAIQLGLEVIGEQNRLEG